MILGYVVARVLALVGQSAEEIHLAAQQSERVSETGRWWCQSGSGGFHFESLPLPTKQVQLEKLARISAVLEHPTEEEHPGAVTH